MNINESFHFVENDNFETNLHKTKIVQIDYPLESFHRSNQDTTLLHKPAVFEGQWVESGDLLADCSTSVGGDLSLGQNLLIGYMPWEGYNYEDAILINERLVFDDLYTSIHIEKYDVEIRETKFGLGGHLQRGMCAFGFVRLVASMGRRPGHGAQLLAGGAQCFASVAGLARVAAAAGNGPSTRLRKQHGHSLFVDSVVCGLGVFHFGGSVVGD